MIHITQKGIHISQFQGSVVVILPLKKNSPLGGWSKGLEVQLFFFGGRGLI
jgi:hypothetical protein